MIVVASSSPPVRLAFGENQREVQFAVDSARTQPPADSGRDELVDWHSEGLIQAVCKMLESAHHSLLAASQLAVLVRDRGLINSIGELSNAIKKLKENQTSEYDKYRSQKCHDSNFNHAIDFANIDIKSINIEMTNYIIQRIMSRFDGLTDSQAQLLLFMIKNCGREFSKNQISVAIKSKSINSNGVKVQIFRIRAHLEKSGLSNTIISTKKGYLIQSDRAKEILMAL